MPGLINPDIMFYYHIKPTVLQPPLSHNKYTKTMNNTKICTIIFFDSEGKASKYRNIKCFTNGDHIAPNRNFLQFAESRNAVTLNLYDKATKLFITQIKKVKQ